MPFLTAFKGRKILLLGFIFVLLVAIPLTVYILQKQQEVRSRAAAATKLYFSQPSQTTPPLTTLQKAVGETFDLDIIVDPGTNQNQVSFIKLNITYDGSRLNVVDSKLDVNETAFPAILEAPSYTSGNTSVTISVGADPAKVITTVTKVATITFKVAAVTVDPRISIAFTGSQVLSIASSDQPSENVLANSIPLSLTIVPATAATPTPGPTATPTPRPSAAPTAPAAAGAPAAPTATPSATLTPTIAVTPTATPAAQVTITPPGPGEAILGVGAVGAVLLLIGGFLLLAL